MGVKAAPERTRTGAKVTPVRVTPVRVTPVRVTPVRVTPVRVTPVRVTPVRVTPVRVTPVSCKQPLSSTDNGLYGGHYFFTPSKTFYNNSLQCQYNLTS